MQNDITNITNWRENETHISDLFHWISEFGIKTFFFEEDIYPSLIAHDTPEGNDINQFDFQFIESIVLRVDFFIERAIQYIKEDIANNPDKFEVTQERAKELLFMPAKEFPVSFPDMNFYPDNTWMIRFADADFPVIEYGEGISVNFRGEEPSGVEILSSEYEIDRDM